MNEYIIEYSNFIYVGHDTIYANCKKEARDKFWSKHKGTPVKFIKWIKR
jgi:hypothetical protein